MNDDHQIPIHPAAECVRLMDADELASLAASIEANGLRDKIILGRINGGSVAFLVDGRNRLRACDMVGLEPQFETRDFANDDEVKAFVADKSEHRNLTKGQQAMRLALLYPEPGRGRGKKDAARKETETSSFSYSRVKQARTVLSYSRDLALAVRDGTKPLDEAMKEVKAARDAVNSEEFMIARLRAEASDLADLVAEERMSAREAITVLDSRIEEQHRKQITATQVLANLVNTWHPRTADPKEFADRMTENVRAQHWPQISLPLTKKDLEAVSHVIAAVAAMADKWEGA